jgi:hypothetical protein
MEKHLSLWWNTTDLAAGTYNYTVTDANGCIATTSVTIDAAPAQITLIHLQIVCLVVKVLLF